MQNNKGKAHTANSIFKHFKKASAESIKIGTAQLEYEDMVRRAEKKISEKERMNLAGRQSTEENAALLAKELLHTPSSMLTKQEIARMWKESDCQNIRKQPNCQSPTVFQFRTLDGTCNNLNNPLFGAAGTNFGRLILPQYEDGRNSLRGNMQNQFQMSKLDPFSPPNPSARFVSTNIIRDKPNEELPFTHVLMQWGQFLDHDLDLSPELEEECESCTFTDICQPIRVAPDDKAFGVGTQNDGDCILFRRSLAGCPMEQPLSFPAREQINDITSYIDGSMVYGSSDDRGKALRLFRNGLLKVGPNFPGNKPSLPRIDEDTARFIACPDRMDCFFCGDARCNEQISLTIMHTIWVREHNRCARELAKINPHWNDERLYQECRRIVGALIQKITYEDYLPKVFGPSNFAKFIGEYKGYNTNIDAGIPNSFSAAAYRYGHSLIRPMFDRLNADFKPLPMGPLKLVDAFFNPSQFRASDGTDPIVRGLLERNSFRMDEFLNIVLTTQLFQTSASPGFDLASLNIQRGRDHGLPPYLIWRNFCKSIFGIASPIENILTKARFMGTYGSLETIDLWIGGLAEARLSESLLGATFSCIFGLTFTGVRDGDRFFYKRPRVFTPSQVQSIEQDSLSRVLCDNLDNLRSVQPDAFLSNQSRVDCNHIPRLDLSLFREVPCYFRIRLPPRAVDTVIDTFYQANSGRFLFSSLKFPASSSTTFQCEEIQCPTSSKPVNVITYPNPDTDGATIIPNAQLPPSISESGSVYQAKWSRSLFGSNQAGIFTSKNACARSSSFALTFSFPKEEVVEVAQNENRIPDYVLELIKSLDFDFNTVSSSAQGEEAFEVMSDAALMQELEDSLDSL